MVFPVTAEYSSFPLLEFLPWHQWSTRYIQQLSSLRTLGFHSGAHRTRGLDIRPIRVVTCSGAGCDRARSRDRVCPSPRRCVPDSDFALAPANRFALDTFCERIGRVASLSWYFEALSLDASVPVKCCSAR